MTISNDSTGRSPVTLTGRQRRYLRGRANALEPLVMVGKQGVTDSLIAAADQALESHELVKVRFQEFKDEKKILIQEIAGNTNSHVAGMIGHVGILYRQHEDPEKRKIELPND